MLIKCIADKCYGFAGCKCGKYSAYAESHHLSEEEKCHGSGDGETYYIKSDLDDRIRLADDIRQLTRKQIGRYNRKLAAVGDSYAEAYYNVAGRKICESERKINGQQADPCGMQVNGLAEQEAYNEAEQILRDETSAQNHQRQYHQALENIGPGTEAQLRKHQ